MTAAWCCVCVVAWLLLSVPLALFFGRACALYQRCQYKEVDDGDTGR